ncbi:phytoene desaturase family protein [Aquimarina sp. 2201CG14-23]|uniref:phytoene desaturase family protein n=1 Tax=Aquimarina mycalae TaxID=3040073 RepID=UPI002477FDF5|nr:NAD(P)/FAD-dependent oxidoreductase [Aquimarina sp. 2201CG14-23]MDH7445629.1 NAD(P)/FAD-dependent oxidoreductase [Aquimarina sp. 2201CG14-23]
MIQSYKKRPVLEENYDAIIIGSGMGSLTVGAILAKEGKKVLILERHYTAGGFTHIFKRKGYEWDVGIHYIGGVQQPNSPIKRLFDYVSNNKLEWADMGSVYDRIIIGEKSYDFVKGVENFRNQMVSYFPNEEKAIDTYIDLVFKANKAMGSFYKEKALPGFLRFLLGGFMRKPYLKYADQTTYGVLSKLTKNEELIKVLSAQYGDYGLPPKQSSFAMHASVARHYFGGGNFPIGGSSRIVDTIDPVIEENAGTILINAAVEEVIIDNNKAKGVRMIDGKEFYADTIISGAGVFNTFEKLIPESVNKQHKLQDQLQKVTPSVSHACLYMGFKKTPEELQLPKTNFWIYPEEGDHDTIVQQYLEDNNAPFPVVYVSFPSAKDPDWSNRYPGRSTIDIITLVPYETCKQWEGTRWMKRGEDYDTWKEKIAQRLMKELFKQLPHLEGQVDHYELSTPLSTQHFVNYDKGEIYGIDHTPDRFRQRFLQPRTPIKGLYLTGQDIVTAGLGGALFAGVVTASAVTGTNFKNKIFAPKS